MAVWIHTRMVASCDWIIHTVHRTLIGIQGPTHLAKVAHIYGNGPSRVFYNDWPHKKKELLVAHNIPEAGINPDVIVVIDSQPIDWFDKNQVFPVARFWVSKRSFNVITHLKIQNKLNVEIVWDDVHRYNAGIYAVKELLNQNYDVHLWGFDSMFSDCLESPAMDKIIARHRRPKHLDKQWQDHWLKVFENRSNTVNVHMPYQSIPKTQLTTHDCIKIHRH